MHPSIKKLRAPLFALTAGALSVASAASAAQPTFEEEMAKFTNVRVVNRPEAQVSTASMPALKAYKDPETGALRAPTQAELEADAAAANASSSARSRFARVAAPQALNASKGGRKVVLDESTMQFSVVTRMPDGTLAEYCATGKDEADAVTKSGITISKGEQQ